MDRAKCSNRKPTAAPLEPRPTPMEPNPTSLKPEPVSPAQSLPLEPKFAPINIPKRTRPLLPNQPNFEEAKKRLRNLIHLINTHDEEYHCHENGRSSPCLSDRNVLFMMERITDMECRMDLPKVLAEKELDVRLYLDNLDNIYWHLVVANVCQPALKREQEFDRELQRKRELEERQKELQQRVLELQHQRKEKSQRKQQRNQQRQREQHEKQNQPGHGSTQQQRQSSSRDSEPDRFGEGLIAQELKDLEKRFKAAEKAHGEAQPPTQDLVRLESSMNETVEKMKDMVLELRPDAYIFGSTDLDTLLEVWKLQRDAERTKPKFN